MAIKGWVKTRNRKNSTAWLNTNSDKTITVEYFKNPDGSFTSVLESSGRSSSFGKFPTKTKAKSVLLKYMRKHPNG